MKFILGQKKQMTQVFQDDGTVVPVTVIKAEPNVVTGMRTIGAAQAALVSGGTKRAKLVAKPQQGQWKDLGSFRHTRQLKTTDALERGAKIDVAAFAVGDAVRVTATSKGKGFAGVVKRHHFKGGPASHGHKDNLRAPGSIGATFPQHVLKGTRMAGRMGNAKVTVTGLTVVAVKPEVNELWISGAVPGARNGLVIVQA
jgi:large subunit ribosomal protein L3